MKKYIVMTVALAAVVAQSALADPSETKVAVLAGTTMGTAKIYYEDENPESMKWKQNMYMIIEEGVYGPGDKLRYTTPPVFVYFGKDDGEKYFYVSDLDYDWYSYSPILRFNKYKGISIASKTYSDEHYRGQLISSQTKTKTGSSFTVGTDVGEGGVRIWDTKSNLRQSPKLTKAANTESYYYQPGTLENGVTAVIMYLESRGYHSTDDD
jgi:hypothetical protein